MTIIIDPGLIMMYIGVIMLIAVAVIFWWNDL
jgi:hypothetical protein